MLTTEPIEPIVCGVGYSPLDDGLSCSTVNMFGGPTVLAVWALILADKDRDGITKLNPDAIYRQWIESREPRSLADVEAAWEYLASPDPKSKSPEEGGRRIIPNGDGRWRVVNAEKYRERYSAERRRNQLAEAQRRHREKRAGREGAAGPAEVTGAKVPDVEAAAPSVPTNGSAREEYARIIGEKALEITGNLQLSSVEFGQILTWREEGIPLRVVLSAIEEGVRPSPGAAPREPRSLRYFDPIVREEWERVQKAGTV